MLTVRGSRFYHPQQSPSIPITICSACFVWSRIIDRDILLTDRACFVVNQGLKSQDILRIYTACFVSSIT